MSKRTYICLDCRTAKRAEAEYGLNTNFRCSECQKEIFELPWNWRIPKRNDDKGWKELAVFVADIKRIWLPRRTERGNDLLQQIDGSIQRIEQSNMKNRENKLNYLRWKRKEMEERYIEE